MEEVYYTIVSKPDYIYFECPMCNKEVELGDYDYN